MAREDNRADDLATADGISRAERRIRRASWANLIAVVGLLVLVYGISEDWWLSAVLVYLPRLPYVIPGVLLCLGSLVWHRRSMWINLLACALVLGPLAGLEWPARGNGSGTGRELCVVSCNVQGFRPDFRALLDEIHALKPDVILLQEARRTHPRIESDFAGWSVVHAGEYVVASRFPVRFAGHCYSTAFHRIPAVKVEIDTPDGTIVLVNVHPMTARRGLRELHPDSLLAGVRKLQRLQLLRHEEMRTTRMLLTSADADRPVIAAGDFNVPTSSSLYRRNWSDLTGAFDRAGTGYGYTAPNARHRLWPDFCPWLRIDHILVNDRWDVLESHAGTSNGSDHRLIAAKLRLRSRDSLDGQ